MKIEGSTNRENNIIDSLGYADSFKDISSLLLEKERLEKHLYKIGFIENKDISTIKSNDSTYLTLYSIGKQYRSLKIYYDKNIVSFDILEAVTDDLQVDHFIIPFNEIEAKLNYINEQLANRDTPFTTLRLKNIQI